jgi:predicted ATPase
VEQLVGARAEELGRLLPEFAAPTESSHVVDPLAQSRLFEALLGLFAGLGKTAPVALVIEDLQWADPSTRGFLSFLVRNIRRRASANLLARPSSRSPEAIVFSPLRSWLSRWRCRARVFVLTPAPPSG